MDYFKTGVAVGAAIGVVFTGLYFTSGREEAKREAINERARRSREKAQAQFRAEANKRTKDWEAKMNR